MGEFDFERGEILTNLTLLEDHAEKFPCPYCMEKHASKIIGYAEEISLGEHDKEMEKLAKEAREWRRLIQGAKEHSHDNPKPRQYAPYAWTECEKKYPKVMAKIKRCTKKIELKQKCPPEQWGLSKDCVNPFAVCRASIPCH